MDHFCLTWRIRSASFCQKWPEVPLMLAILPTCTLVLLGVLSCRSVFVHAVISVCVFLPFNCGLDVFLQPGWRHDRLWVQALKLVPCLSLSYELERLSRCWDFFSLICRHQNPWERTQERECMRQNEYIPIKTSRGTNLRPVIYMCRHTPPSCETRPEISGAEILLLEGFPMEGGIKYQITRH